METTYDAMRIFMPAVITFLFGIGFTPVLSYFLYTYKFWKPKGGKIALDGTTAETFNKLHEKKRGGYAARRRHLSLGLNSFYRRRAGASGLNRPKHVRQPFVHQPRADLVAAFGAHHRFVGGAG